MIFCPSSQIVGDAKKRQEYDTLGQAFGGAGGGGAGGFQGQWQGGNIDPEELFRNIFGSNAFGGGAGGGTSGFDESIFGSGFNRGHEVIQNVYI